MKRIFFGLFKGKAAEGEGSRLLGHFGKFKFSSSTGFSLVEVLVAVAILAILAFGISRFILSSKRVSSTLSDSTDCLNAAQSILDGIKTAGQNLEILPPYMPVAGDRTGANLSSTKAFRALGILTPNPTNAEIVSLSNSPIVLGNSLFLMNSVNLVQAIHNTNPAEACSENPVNEFGLEIPNALVTNSLLEPKVFVNARPYNISSQTTLDCPRSPVYTSPRGRSNPNIPNLSTLGDPDLGFEATVTVQYKSGETWKHCQASANFQHQGDIAPPIIAPSSIRIFNGNDIDLGTTGGISCDNTGPQFNIIDVVFDVREIEPGSTFLCRGRAAANNSFVPMTSNWTPCDQMQFTGYQSGATQVPLWNGNELGLRFNGLTGNMYYFIEFVAVDTAGNSSSPPTSSSFAIDISRPAIVRIEATNVGQPGGDGPGGTYDGPEARWESPPNPFAGGNWLQCNSNSVTITAYARDVIGPAGCTEGSIPNNPGIIASNVGCQIVTQSGLQSSINTVQFKGVDSCGVAENFGPVSATWHIDLPPANFDLSKPVNQIFPNNNEIENDEFPDGRFYEMTVGAPKASEPSHFVVQCDCNPVALQDGDGTCGAVVDIAKYGCTPTAANNFSARVFHICGTSEIVSAKYEVLGDEADPCTTQSCGPDLACCKSSEPGECGITDGVPGVFGRCYGFDSYTTPSCTNPVTGSPQASDSQCAPSAPLGLLNCEYRAECVPSGVFAGLNSNPDCVPGLREGDDCNPGRRRGDCNGSGLCCSGSVCVNSTPPYNSDNHDCATASVGDDCYIYPTGTCGPLSFVGCSPTEATPSDISLPSAPANQICLERKYDSCILEGVTTTTLEPTTTTTSTTATTLPQACDGVSTFATEDNCVAFVATQTAGKFYCDPPVPPSTCYTVHMCEGSSSTNCAVTDPNRQSCTPSSTQPKCSVFKDCNPTFISATSCDTACSADCTPEANGCFSCGVCTPPLFSTRDLCHAETECASNPVNGPPCIISGDCFNCVTTTTSTTLTTITTTTTSTTTTHPCLGTPAAGWPTQGECNSQGGCGPVGCRQRPNPPQCWVCNGATSTTSTSSTTVTTTPEIPTTTTTTTSTTTTTCPLLKTGDTFPDSIHSAFHPVIDGVCNSPETDCSNLHFFQPGRFQCCSGSASIVEGSENCRLPNATQCNVALSATFKCN